LGPGMGPGAVGRCAERTQSPAPNEPNLPRRTNPIPRRANPSVRLCSPGCGFVRNGGTGGRATRRRGRAERTRAPAPSEPERRPSVRRGAAPCGKGPGAGPRTARDLIVKEHPTSSRIRARAFYESAAGRRFASGTGPPEAGVPGLRRTHDHPGTEVFPRAHSAPRPFALCAPRPCRILVEPPS
jgi:hypothetical protein